jgi:hypothetical protein
MRNVKFQKDFNNSEYSGKVKDISEELSKLIVDTISEEDLDEIELSLPIEEQFSGYKDYRDKSYSTKTSKESFKTLSDLEYCIINKL